MLDDYPTCNDAFQNEFQESNHLLSSLMARSVSQDIELWAKLKDTEVRKNVKDRLMKYKKKLIKLLL